MRVLEDIGLTKSEISVYFALIKLGSSSTGPIVREAGISSGKIYEVLGKLIDKGLCTYIIKSGRKYFKSTDPERLDDYLRKKERKINESKSDLNILIKKLKTEISLRESQQEAEIFEGIEGFKTYSEFCLKKLKKNSDYYILGVSKEVNSKFGAYLLDWQKRRAKKGVRLKIIYNDSAIEHGKKRDNIPLTSVRYLPKNMETPALIEIFEDYVSTTIVTPKPIIFLIKSRQAAKSYVHYFNLMWSLSKKL